MKKWQLYKLKELSGIVGGHLAKPGEHPYQVFSYLFYLWIYISPSLNMNVHLGLHIIIHF